MFCRGGQGNVNGSIYTGCSRGKSSGNARGTSATIVISKSFSYAVRSVGARVSADQLKW